MHEDPQRNKAMMTSFMDNYPHRSFRIDPDTNDYAYDMQNMMVGVGDNKSLSDVKYQTYKWEIDPETIADYQRHLDHSGHNIDPVEVEQDIYDQVLEEAEIKKAEEIAAAGKAYWDAVMQGAIEFLGGGGMLKSDEQNKQSDDKLIALAQQQADAITSLANAQTSTDVAKDLEEETTKKDSGGRNKPVKMENLRGEKPGYSMAEGSNFWSVNEKDPYWQTKEGFKEVMNLYGTKPSWVKEPSLEYNPRTGEYDSIEKEEFVEIKPKKRISL